MRMPQAFRTALFFGGRCLIALTLALSACQDDADRLSGRGTEAENEIHGMLVDASGMAVAGARVVAYSGDLARQSPATAQDSDVTDSEGRYDLRRLTPGTYNIVGEHQEAALSVLIPGIDYSEGPALDLGADTLLAPGRLEGRVLKGDAGKAGVLVYAPGTTFLAVTDAAGAFQFPNLPDGIYGIRYQVSGFQVASDSNVIVRTGRLTRLADKILALDTALPPPAPSEVGATLDTLTSHVTLRWDSVDIADLAGYRVYRDDGAFSLPVAISNLVAGNRFTDSSLGQLANAVPPPEVGYRIRTLDREMNEGDEFSIVARVRIVSPSLVTTRMQLAEISPHPGKIGLGKTGIFRLEFGNPTRRILRLAWKIDGALQRETDVDLLAGSDSLAVSWASEGFHTVAVAATDEAGTVWIASVLMESILDAPLAGAGPDTTVSLGDTVRLRPFASDLLGRIVSWEWNIGAEGEFRTVPSGGLDVQVPAMPRDAYPCILRVTDDEGHIGLDTLNVRILADPPIARITAARLEAFQGDTLVLSASDSRDSLGRIVRLEWDVGATEIFGSGTGEEVKVTASQPQDVSCALRVTDDDGQTDTARVVLRFVTRDRWVLWGKAPALQGIRQFHTWVHSGRLWLMAQPLAGMSRSAILWHSRDLRQWDSVPSVRLTVPYAKPAVQGKRIWKIGEGAGVLEYSDDGLEWYSLVSESFPNELGNESMLEHAGKIWLLGTRDSANTRRSEVWSSPDGLTWDRITNNPEYGFRVISAAASWNGRLWIFGNSWSQSMGDQDLWSSTDGLSWRREAGGIFPGIRQGLDMFVHEGELWMMSSRSGDGLYRGEARRSGDGKIWVDVPSDTPEISGSYGYVNTVVFNGRLWIFSSTERMGLDPIWEIWQGPH